MGGEGETPFHLFPLSPNKFYLNFHFFYWSKGFILPWF
jgi:hypothetical protein